MKKEFGSLLALYPMPVTVVSSMHDGKPTYTEVCHVGIMGHDRVMVSLASSHFINGCIKKTKKLVVHLVSKEMLDKVDVAGSVSGNNQDKSDLFDFEVKEDLPIIKKSPLAMTCSVEDIYLTPGFENFICKIDATYIEEEYVQDSKPDYEKMNVCLFDFPNYEYLQTGSIVGKCGSFKN